MFGKEVEVYITGATAGNVVELETIYHLLKERRIKAIAGRAGESGSRAVLQAEAFGIRYVLFFVVDDLRVVRCEVKDLKTGEQVAAKPNTWTPEEERPEEIRTWHEGETK